MQIEPTTTLQDLGKDFSKARRLFRRLHLDVDTHTHLTVSEACEKAGISIKDFTRSMAVMTTEPGSEMPVEAWTDAPLADLVHHIQEHHHSYSRTELARLERLLDETIGAHGGAYPELAQLRGHFHFLKEDLLAHLDVEDNTIFPAIVKGVSGDQPPVFATLEDLQHMAMKENEAVEELFQNISLITRNFSLPLEAPPAIRSIYLGLRDLEEDLYIHMYLENQILFPRTVQGAPGTSPA